MKKTCLNNQIHRIMEAVKAILVALAMFISVASVQAQGVMSTVDISANTVDLVGVDFNTGSPTPILPDQTPAPISGPSDFQSSLTIQPAPEPSSWAIALLSTGLIFVSSRFSRRFQIRSEQS